MIAIRLLTIPLAVLAAGLGLSGCYTLLKHPTVNNAAYAEAQSNSCTSCHDEDELWYYHHAPVHRTYPGPMAGAWGFYYEMPWWYDAYWGYSPSSGSGPIPLPGRQVRTGVDKRDMQGADGFVGPPPPVPKSTGSVRYRHTGDDSERDSQGSGETKAKDDEPKKRDVRPKTGKDKKKQSEKEKPGE